MMHTTTKFSLSDIVATNKIDSGN